MLFFYNIGVRLYGLAIRIAALFKPKAKQWLDGRKQWQTKYAPYANTTQQKTIWFHCASLGEFEMARPVIEHLKALPNDPYFILITFFSPSGYTVQKNYVHANAVVYLPLDTATNAKTFVTMFKPHYAVFVKYEIWINYLQALKQQHAYVVLMNAVFRKEHRFFKWYGGVFREALQGINQIFVQDQISQDLLKGIGVESVRTGDTRYDRVLQIKNSEKNIDTVKEWVNGRFCIVCGSTWPAEEKIIAETIQKAPQNIAWIIVPHDVAENHIVQITTTLSQSTIRYSQMHEQTAHETQVLVVDKVGFLAQLYALANVAIVGGGFSGKLHNILEPAVYGIPVLFGPKYTRFQEAVEMVEAKAAISFYDDADIILYIEWFYYDHVMVDKVKVTQHFIFEKNRGAVLKVTNFLQKL